MSQRWTYLSAFVPRSNHALKVGSQLHTEDVAIVNTAPALDLAFGIISFEATVVANPLNSENKHEPSHNRSSLGRFPHEVVLLSFHQLGHPEIRDSPVPGGSSDPVKLIQLAAREIFRQFQVEAQTAECHHQNFQPREERTRHGGSFVLGVLLKRGSINDGDIFREIFRQFQVEAQTAELHSPRGWFHYQAHCYYILSLSCLSGGSLLLVYPAIRWSPWGTRRCLSRSPSPPREEGEGGDGEREREKYHGFFFFSSLLSGCFPCSVCGRFFLTCAAQVFLRHCLVTLPTYRECSRLAHQATLCGRCGLDLDGKTAGALHRPATCLIMHHEKYISDRQFF